MDVTLSSSTTTTGLIGGRFGDTGGLGVRVNLDGTTLLFANAHLATHEGRAQYRLYNLAKIKVVPTYSILWSHLLMVIQGELTVDDFLSNDDRRLMGEDLTDRFDYTFIFRDLDFRLEISRLHADWLISRRDYAQALDLTNYETRWSTERPSSGSMKEITTFRPPSSTTSYALSSNSRQSPSGVQSKVVYLFRTLR